MKSLRVRILRAEGKRMNHREYTQKSKNDKKESENWAPRSPLKACGEMYSRVCSCGDSCLGFIGFRVLGVWGFRGFGVGFRVSGFQV